MWIVIGSLAMAIFTGNFWVVRSAGDCKAGNCQCVITIFNQGVKSSSNPSPSCGVIAKWKPLWLFSPTPLVTCSIVDPSSADQVIMCDAGKAAKVKCTNTAEFTVENGKAKTLACQEDDAGISRVASSNYGSWVNNKLSTDASNIMRRSPLRQWFRPGRSLYRPRDSGGSNSATIITESEAITVISGDAGVQLDSGELPRVTVGSGQVSAVSFCDGSTAVLNGPSVTNIVSTAGIDMLLTGNYTLTPGCADDQFGRINLTGRWIGGYILTNRTTGALQGVPLEFDIQGTGGTVTASQDILDITSMLVDGSGPGAGMLTMIAQPRSQAGPVQFKGTFDKGNLIFQTAGFSTPDYLEGAGSAQRLYIAQWALPKAALNAPYVQPLYAISNADGDMSWAITAGSLPNGISLDPASGVLSGSATATGTYSFTVRVTDATGDQFQQALQLTVANLVLVSNILPAGYLGQPYQCSLQVVGGQPPYTWQSDYAFPFPVPGLAQLSSDGTLTLDSVQSGAGLTFRVTDSHGLSQHLGVAIPVRGLTITGSQSLPGAVTGMPFSYTFSAAGNNGTVTWSVNTDLTGSGLALDTATGILSGIPPQDFDMKFSVSAQDSVSTDTRQFLLESATPPDTSAKRKACPKCGKAAMASIRTSN
jgi:hypothetical protein